MRASLRAIYGQLRATLLRSELVPDRIPLANRTGHPWQTMHFLPGIQECRDPPTCHMPCRRAAASRDARQTKCLDALFARDILGVSRVP
eukprot:gene19255-biopygen22025